MMVRLNYTSGDELGCEQLQLPPIEALQALTEVKNSNNLHVKDSIHFFNKLTVSSIERNPQKSTKTINSGLSPTLTWLLFRNVFCSPHVGSSTD